MFNQNVRQTLHILELAGKFTCTWPIDPKSSKREIAFRNFLWAFAVLNVILLMISMAFAIFYLRSNIVTSIQAATQMTALLDVFIDLILCRKNCVRLQILIGKLKTFVNEAKEHHSTMIQRYVDRYAMCFSMTGMGYVVTGISFCLMPLFSAQELPTDGWIPFSVEPLGVYCIVYAAQVFCILQAVFGICVDFTVAMLFSFSAAKLDILGMKLRQVKGYDILVSCVKEHQEIIRYVEDTEATVEALLFKTNATMACAMICGSLPLIYNQSLAVISQFLPLVVSGCAHLFVISWPADDLRESSVRFAKSISDIQWLGESRRTKSAVIIMMQRSQRTFLIRMSALLPPLSLEYYANFLTTLSSYLMATRAMVESQLF